MTHSMTHSMTRPPRLPNGQPAGLPTARLTRLWTILGLVCWIGTAPLQASDHQEPELSSPWKAMPRAFIENAGQWHPELLFRQGRGLTGTAVFADGFGVSLRAPMPSEGDRWRASALRFRFEGASMDRAPRGKQRQSGEYNFLKGNDPGAWCSAVGGFGRVVFDGVWPGIDVVLRDGEGLFEYDLVLDPGAELSVATLRVAGAIGMELDAQGRLVFETESGPLIQSAPVAWSRDPDGMLRDQPCEFVLLGEDRFGFVAPELPAGHGLVIDPGVRWGTLLGHEDFDIAHALELAPGGEVVVAGSTFSADFPIIAGSYDVSWNGGYDAFVLRITADGSGLVYSTFLGGDGTDNGTALALAPDGTVFVAGESSSASFPVTSGAHDTSFGGVFDGFVCHLDAQGANLLASTWIGSSLIERVSDLVLDGSGRPVLCGSTASSGFPTVFNSYDRTFGGGGGDAFVSRFSSGLDQLEFSSFLGSTGNEGAQALSIGGDGSITVGGWTRSSNFPTTSGVVDGALGSGSGAQDGFVTRFDPDGQSLLWSTFLGGGQLDEVKDVACFANGDCLVVGGTKSSDFPLGPAPHQGLHGGGSDAFVARLSGDASQLVHSSFFGGGQDDEATSVALLAGEAFAICGETSSTDLLVDPWSFDSRFGTNGNGITDVYVARFEADGTRSYSTYLGGNSEERGLAIAGDGTGGVVLCGETNSYGFPVTSGAFDTSYDFSTVPDGFLCRLTFERFPFPYGTAKINSVGGWAALTPDGFPSFGGDGFTIWSDGALSNSLGLFFYSDNAGNVPFAGGELLMSAPFQRTPVQQLGWLGSAHLDVSIDASMVGTTRYYQFWYQDSGDSFGVGLSGGLEVRFYP